jgi:DmX-like protein
MRNLSVALSACIYQCLCDSDSFSVAGNDGTMVTCNVGMEGFTSTAVVYKDSHLMSGAVQQQTRQRHSSSSGPEIPNSQPVKWPG